MCAQRTPNPRSLIRVFVVRKKIHCITGHPKCAQWRFWSDCVNAQVDMRLHWAHMSLCPFLVANAFVLEQIPSQKGWCAGKETGNHDQNSNSVLAKEMSLLSFSHENSRQTLTGQYNAWLTLGILGKVFSRRQNDHLDCEEGADCVAFLWSMAYILSVLAHCSPLSVISMLCSVSVTFPCRLLYYFSPYPHP